MASLPPTSGSPETGNKRSPAFLIVGLGAALLAVAAGAFFFLGGESKPKKKTTSVVNVM
ncbi:MAG: LPXTG cell wall anchor domain-containing protein, partial [Chthoniobacterales bacterium]|nr:LPXTG cell wall anchor domain-containing protein [Chthoniobacterales bacterium]